MDLHSIRNHINLTNANLSKLRPMSDTDVLKWISKNVSGIILRALSERPDAPYTDELLAGITCRETGDLIQRHINDKTPTNDMFALMRGDYTQRPGETEKQYHGFGLTQIDINSFPDFVKSGDWKNPLKCYLKTIDVLEGKRKYILSKTGNTLANPIKFVIAAYNCGEGNELKVISRHLDADAYTTGHDYSTAVYEFAEIYKNLV